MLTAFEVVHFLIGKQLDVSDVNYCDIMWTVTSRILNKLRVPTSIFCIRFPCCARALPQGCFFTLQRKQ